MAPALAGHDQRVVQPGIDQRAEHIAFLLVFPGPCHRRFVSDSLIFDEAIDHERGVHGHSLPRTLKT